jgi:hypothetical protein
VAETFPVTVAGVGVFIFRRRTMRDLVGVEAEADRITGGPTSNVGIQRIARQFGELTVMMESAPPGWALEELDPLDTESIQMVLTISEAYHEAEATFLSARKAGREAARVGNGGDGGVRVPAPVQPAA